MAATTSRSETERPSMLQSFSADGGERQDAHSVVPKVTETRHQGPRKRGRPSTRGNREWLDGEIFMLIELWSRKEELFNCHSPNYQNKYNRSKAMNSIRDELFAAGIEVDIRQIQDKMTNIRNYFAAELRKINASKKNEAGDAFVYRSSWKFFTHLNFLKDNLNPRSTTIDLTASPNQAIETTPYSLYNAPSAKSARKMRDEEQSNAEKAMERTVKVLDKFTVRREKKEAYEATDERRPVQSKEDRCFVELLYQMLLEIPDSEQKALTKLQIQQMLIHLRYSYGQKESPAMVGQMQNQFMYHQMSRNPSPHSVASGPL